MNIDDYLWFYLAAQLQQAEADQAEDKIARRVRQIADRATRIAQKRVQLAASADAAREARRKDRETKR